jgi:hypothetical protein
MYGLTERSAIMPIFIRVYFSAGPGYLVPFQSAYQFSNANGRTWASLIHTYVHTYIHEYKHTYILTYTRTNIQSMDKIMATLDNMGIKLFVLAALKEH